MTDHSNSTIMDILTTVILPSDIWSIIANFMFMVIYLEHNIFFNIYSFIRETLIYFIVFMCCAWVYGAISKNGAFKDNLNDSLINYSCILARCIKMTRIYYPSCDSHCVIHVYTGRYTHILIYRRRGYVWCSIKNDS